MKPRLPRIETHKGIHKSNDAVKTCLTSLLCSLALGSAAFADDNIWTSPTDGKWEDGADWSLAVAPANNQFCYLTNAGSKTVTIDATTAGSYPATMTVSNLIVGSQNASTNTLALMGAGTANPLDVLDGFSLLGGGLVISNSAFSVDGVGYFTIDGTACVDSGSFTATNAGTLIIGSQQPGTFNATNSQINLLASNGILKVGLNTNGTLNLVNSTTLVQSLYLGDPGVTGSLLIDGGSYTSPFDINVGDGGAGLMTVSGAASVHPHGLYVGAAGPGTGTLTLLGGSLNPDQADIGGAAGSTGLLVISNGALNTGSFVVGLNGNGTLDIAGGTVQTSFMPVGQYPGSSGSVILQGGALNVAGGVFGALILAGGVSTTGSVSVVSGTLTNSNGAIIVGQGGQGTFDVSGGSVVADDGFNLGVNPGATGALTVSGGSVVSDGSIFCGTNGGGTGSISVLTNGTLIVTNGAGDGTIALGPASSLTLNGGLLQVDNLALTNGGNFTNSGGTLVYLGAFQLESNTTVTVNQSGVVNAAANFILGAASNSAPAVVVSGGGSLNVATNMTLGSGANSSATVTVTDGATLTATNGVFGVGNNGTTNGGGGTASVTVSNATVLADTVILGSTAGGTGSLALQANATVNVASSLTVVSPSLLAPSVVTVAGGALNVPNGTLSIGSLGSGQMNISGGRVTALKVKLGGVGPGSSGAIALNSGFLRAAGFSANFIVIGGGDLDGSGGTVIIGEDHDATMLVNSGSATNIGTLYVGYTPGFTGTFTQNGGLVVVTTNLIVGGCGGGALGVPTLSGGTLYVTNAAHNAILDVRNGTFQLNAGATLVADILIVTNSCGHFLNSGGTLTYGQLLLDPNQSAAGDGIPNAWKQRYGFNPFDPTVAAADPDHDGQSNLNEYLAGTDPTNAASVFRMISATVNSPDVRVDWSTVGGHSYVVQTNRDLGAGLFGDLSPLITVSGTEEGTTNYVHVGGATNGAGFYRVRLGP